MIFQHTHTWITGVSPHTGLPKTQTRRLVVRGFEWTMVQDRERPIRWYANDGLLTITAPILSVWAERPGKPPHLRYGVGKTYAVQPGRGQRAIGRFTLRSIGYAKAAGNISEADARAEGFASPDDFRVVWRQMHGAAALDMPCWVLGVVAGISQGSSSKKGFVMPCNSIAIAQVQISNLERMLLGTLASIKIDRQLRDALYQAIINQLQINGVEAHRQGMDLYTDQATIHLGREWADVRSLSKRGSRRMLTALTEQVGTALKSVAVQFIAEQVKADLVREGFTITHDISTQVRTLAWSKPVGHRLVTGEVLIAQNGAMALRTTAGTFEVGSDLLTMIREMMRAQGVEWQDEWKPEQHRPNDPGEWVDAHEHPPWEQMQAEVRQHFDPTPRQVVVRR